MRLRFFALAVAAAFLLAGCAKPSTTSNGTTFADVSGDNLPVGADLLVGPGGGPPLLAGPALWPDPQNAPHPAFGWATLSNPAVGPNVPMWWKPIQGAELPAHISGLKHVTKVGGNVTSGAGITLFGGLAFDPAEGAGSWTVDIRDPMHPFPLGAVDSAGRGAGMIAYPNGRLVAVSSAGGGFDVVEITDPVHPVIVNHTDAPTGGHKLGVVPGTPIVYNAGSNGGDPGVHAGPVNVPHPLYGPGLCNVDISQCVGTTEVYNLTDPEHPVLAEIFHNGLSCHHIFFWNALDGSKQRAICAGIQYTQLWDTANPLDPKVIVSLPVHSGVAGTPSAMASIEAFSHTAGINIKGDILYVGDESGGGGAPPGCVVEVNVPGVGAVSTPVGATWFYNIADETNPKVLGWFSPSIGPNTFTTLPGGENPVGAHSTSCTTHHGRMVPDREGRDLLAMSYYGDGVILIDFSHIALGTQPVVVDSFAQDSNTWETAYNNGYLFTGDLARGMDVLTFR